MLFVLIVLTIFQMFDRTLCVRQLRYSGMMETARIRSAGYPIRYGYTEFVHRYRHLAIGIGPAHRVDCRESSKRICFAALSPESDYQFGETKIFLKDSDDLHLEKERTRIYLKHVLILQRGFRRVIFKRWLQRHREASVIIQKWWRARGCRPNFLIIRQGIYRLQACLKSRQLSYDYGKTRKTIIGLQASCRGFLTRKNLDGRIIAKAKRMTAIRALRVREEEEFRLAGNVQWREEAESNYVQRLADLDVEFTESSVTIRKAVAEHRINIEEDEKMVDFMFEFLPGSPEMEVRSKKHIHNSVSQMITSFEEKSKVKKFVPSKLLSAPVNFYTYESRL